MDFDCLISRPVKVVEILKNGDSHEKVMENKIIP